MTNVQLDEAQRFEELEWSSIMTGAYHNPEMAKKMFEEKEMRAKGEEEADKVTAEVKKAAENRVPQEDPAIQDKIRNRYDEDIVMTLSDMIPEDEDAGA